MHKKVIVIIKTNPWKRVEKKWEWLQKQTAGGEKKVHVIVGKHKLDNLRPQPFMTIFTSSVKETKKMEKVSFVVDVFAETPSNYSMRC